MNVNVNSYIYEHLHIWTLPPGYKAASEARPKLIPVVTWIIVDGFINYTNVSVIGSNVEKQYVWCETEYKYNVKVDQTDEQVWYLSECECKLKL